MAKSPYIKSCLGIKQTHSIVKQTHSIVK